ncbi:MAG: NHLP bacteriocin export ABC transporter permease/ATPase subunit [Chloroflexi bacterium]|nr:NHLP bacteriocin export ABC transporter permease/ATPase subunit [Chloroflexota bacterium]
MNNIIPERTPADRLLDLALFHGERFMGGGNRPIRLSDPDTLWFVVQGSVDVFAAQIREDGVPTDFKHMLQAGPGRLLFPAPEDTELSVLVAKGLPESELRRLPTNLLTEDGLDEEIVEQANFWVGEFSESIVSDVTYRPRLEHHAAPGIVEEADAGATISAQQGVVWASSEEGDLLYLGTEDLAPSGSGLVPVTTFSWVVQGRSASVKGIDTADLRRQRRLVASLMEFNGLAMRADLTNRALLLADVSNLQIASTLHRQRSEEQARLDLYSVLDGDTPHASDSSLLMRALESIGRHEDVAFRMPQRSQRGASSGEAPELEDILSASDVRSRRIALRARHRWWLSDSGAMLATHKEDNSPVALIPGASGRYRMVSPQSGRSVPVTAQRAAALEQAAYFFYRPMTDGPTAKAVSLLRLSFNRVQGDLARLLGAGLLSSLASLAPAVMLGVFASHVLPSDDLGMLAMVTLALALIGLNLALLEILRGTAMMRLEARAAARVTAALWDHLLVLPSSFFRRFTAGDLGTRAMGFQHLRDQVAGIAGGALLSLVFLLPTFVLMFLYDTALGWLGLGLGIVSLGVTLYLGMRQLPHHRQLLDTSRLLTGVLLQLIGGVAKLRSSGAEGSAFAMWATTYRQQKRTEMQLGALNEHLIAFTSAAPFFAMTGLLAVALPRMEQGLTIGGFLAIYAAFMIFYGAVTQFGFSFSAIAFILPTIEQTRPILAERPRRGAIDAPMLELQGELRIDHVTFRYTDDGPIVLRDVSLYARPGEFIALVGESGSGKSTLLRLALGLESPISGAVYYDGHDLERLNRRSVRDGVGMVVQDASLRPQTVMDNIIGTGEDLTVEDAWRAARIASVDDDIEAMPMGMYTVTSEGSSTFSGGQAQRMMLASALVRNPSVLLLDEATNWLDNETQSKVMEEIEKLSMTRIVSAHRLSTIRRADRIYVLQGGRIVQQGSFDELIAEEGVFQEMTLRQMT